MLRGISYPPRRSTRPRIGNVCRSDGAVDDFASPFKGSEDRTASRQLRGAAANMRASAEDPPCAR